MHIPEFLLPSDMSQRIRFRMPTVGDAITYSGHDPDNEQAAISEYLDALQTGPVTTCRKWTDADRLTALWWVFIHSRIDPVMSFGYECDHCGEDHTFDLDLRDLGDDIHIIDGKSCFEDVEISVQGKPHIWRIQHLTGEAMELLEGLKNGLPDVGEPGYQLNLMDFRLWEMVFQCELNDEIETDYTRRADKRYELLRSMDIESEFRVLAACIKLLRDTTRHGLPVTTDKGVTRIAIKSHMCPHTQAKEAAEQRFTPMLLRFHPSGIVPRFEPGWLGEPFNQPGHIWWPEHA